jgi:hypothetical protein
MMSVNMLSVIVMSVIVMSIIGECECHFAESHYDECHYADRRGTYLSTRLVRMGRPQISASLSRSFFVSVRFRKVGKRFLQLPVGLQHQLLLLPML